MTDTTQAHSEPSQTSKMEPFALQTLPIIFVKSFLGVDYMVKNLSRGWNFNSLIRDETSSRMISVNNVKVELRLYAKISSR